MDETTRRTEALAGEAEAALWLQQTVLAHRSTQGWEVCDLLDQGLSVADAAARLDISASAVSQRHTRASREQALRGRALCTRLVGALQQLVAA